MKIETSNQCAQVPYDGPILGENTEMIVREKVPGIGLRPGDKILAVGGTPVTKGMTARDWRAAWQKILPTEGQPDPSGKIRHPAGRVKISVERKQGEALQRGNLYLSRTKPQALALEKEVLKNLPPEKASFRCTDPTNGEVRQVDIFQKGLRSLAVLDEKGDWRLVKRKAGDRFLLEYGPARHLRVRDVLAPIWLATPFLMRAGTGLVDGLVLKDLDKIPGFESDALRIALILGVGGFKLVQHASYVAIESQVGDTAATVADSLYAGSAIATAILAAVGVGGAVPIDHIFNALSDIPTARLVRHGHPGWASLYEMALGLGFGGLAAGLYWGTSVCSPGRGPTPTEFLEAKKKGETLAFTPASSFRDICLFSAQQAAIDAGTGLVRGIHYLATRNRKETEIGRVIRTHRLTVGPEIFGQREKVAGGGIFFSGTF